MNDTALPKATIGTHLSELRNRALTSAGSVLAGSVISFGFRDQILALLTRPFNETLYYTSPAGGLELALGISFGAGVVIAFPVIVYECLSFLMPAAGKPIGKLIARYLIASWVLLVTGMVFAYYVSLPAALALLKSFASGQVRSLISADQYLGFICSYLAGFGLLFQLPVVLLLVDALVPLKPVSLLRAVPYVILVSFIAAAVLTPTPDLINQSVMALVPIDLYAATIVILAIRGRRR